MAAVLKNRTLWVVVVIAALALSLLTVLKWTSGSDFSLKSAQSSVAVTANAEAVMAVSVDSKSSTPAVKFSIAHAPAGVSLTSNSDAAKSAHIVVLTFAASSSVKPGTYPVTVKGTSGSYTHSFATTLTVHTRPAFRFVMRPSVRTVVSRASTHYSLVFYPGHNPATPTFTVTGLPTNATYTITKRSWPNGALYWLNVSTTVDVAPGSYLLGVHIAIGSDGADASAYLVVNNLVVKDFTISGDARNPLFPGKTSPINLAISNTYQRDLTVSALNVAISGTSNPACAASNFAITQYSGPSMLTVPAHTKKTLSQLGVVTSAWPQIKMINLLHVNQDACKNITIDLTYSGSGSGT